MNELTIPKERLEQYIRSPLEHGFTRSETMALAHFALSAMDSEPVADVVAWSSPNEERKCDIRWRRHDVSPGPLYAAPPAPTPAVPDSAEILNEICDLFHIGEQARTRSAIMTNIQNTIGFADQLRAVEQAFFMVPGEPDEDYPDEEPADECLVNSWGSTVEQYVEQFRNALPVITGAATHERQIRDLVMMVKLLVRTVRKYNPGSQQAKDFTAYLQREGLISASDCLRDGSENTARLTEEASVPERLPIGKPVAWQCLRKGPGRFVVTLERVVAEEWARKGWPMRALCECNPHAAFFERSPDGAKDPE